MLNYSLINLIDDIEDFADNHSQINEFGFGDISNISTKDTNYPLLWLVNTPSYSDGSQFKMNFDVYILDRELQDHSNLKYILNETLFITNDIYNYFKYNPNLEYRLDNKPQYTPFTFRFDDVLSGYKINIELEIIDNGSACEYIPTN